MILRSSKVREAENEEHIQKAKNSKNRVFYIIKGIKPLGRTYA
jgi:hypothetical protein